MNRSTFVLLSAALALVSCRSAPPPVNPSPPQALAREERAEAPTFRLPDGARPRSYRLELTVRPDTTAVQGREQVQVELLKPTKVLWLNARGVTVRSAEWQTPGASPQALTVVPGGSDFVGFQYPRPQATGTGTLNVTFESPVQEKDWQGIFRQKEQGELYVYTQFESTFARRAFPCFDEPGFKVPWQLVLTVPEADVAVSNTPIQETVAQPGGLKRLTFAPTPPLPSYLVAFAVGPFETVEAGSAGAAHTSLRVLLPKGHPGEAVDLAHVMGPLLDLEESYFGRPFPYAKLDLAVVPVFFGAMENAGLITYGQGLALSKPQEDTLQTQHERASVFAHELAHQWFGDLVTLAWWDDVWLNESFTSWMTAHTLLAWKPQLHEEFGELDARTNAMRADALVSARAIHQAAGSQEEIEAAFASGIAYDKGQTVIAMMETWMGPDVFRRGIQLYLTEHANANATSAQLYAALSKEAGKDVGPVFRSFVDQAGVPLVSLSLDCPEGHPASVHLSQRRYLALGTKTDVTPRWEVPMCLKWGEGKQTHQSCTLLKEESMEFPLTEARACPAWLLPNAGGLGYYRSELQGSLFSHLLATKGAQATTLELVSLLGDASALVLSGQLKEAERLSLVPALSSRPEPQIQDQLLTFADPSDILVAPALRPLRARFLRKNFSALARRLGPSPKKSDDEATRALRARVVGVLGADGNDTAIRARARALALAWLKKTGGPSPDMLEVTLGLAARDAPPSFVQEVIAAARQEQDRARRTHMLVALGACEDPAQLSTLLPLALDESLPPLDTVRLLFGLAGHEATREQTYTFLKEHFTTLAARVPAQLVAGFTMVGTAFCDEAHRLDVEKFFAPRVAQYPGARHSLDTTLERMDQCIRLAPERRTSIAKFLRAQ